MIYFFYSQEDSFFSRSSHLPS